MAQGRSTVGTKTIFKNSKDGLNVTGIYKLSVTNQGLLTVAINDTAFGEIKIDPGITILIDGHPDYPFDVSITVEFNELGPATDKITIIYTRVYGNSENNNNNGN